HLDDRRLVPLLDVDRAAVEDFLVPVQVPDERLDAALEVERPLAIGSLVDEGDPDAFGQIRRLADPLTDRLERIFGRLEHLRVRAECRGGSAPIALRADLLDRPERLAPRVLLGPDSAVACLFDAHP